MIEDLDSPLGDPSAAAEPPAESARCVVHPHVASVGTCSHCGSFSCADCLGELGGTVVCRTCVTEGRVQIGRSPWDRREELGLLPAFLETAKAVCFEPSRFFSELAPRHLMGGAILFAVIAGTIGQWANVLYTSALMAVFSDSMTSALPASLAGTPWATIFRPGGPLQLVLTAVFAPVQVVAGAMVSGVTAHLGLMLVGGTTKPLEASLKVACYALAVNLWLLVPLPYLNGIVVWTWSLVVLAIGLKNMHQTTALKAAFAILWLPVTCLCVVAVGAGAAILVLGLG